MTKSFAKYIKKVSSAIKRAGLSVPTYILKEPDCVLFLDVYDNGDVVLLVKQWSGQLYAQKFKPDELRELEDALKSFNSYTALW